MKLRYFFLSSPTLAISDLFFSHQSKSRLSILFPDPAHFLFLLSHTYVLISTLSLTRSDSLSPPPVSEFFCLLAFFFPSGLLISLLYVHVFIFIFILNPVSTETDCFLPLWITNFYRYIASFFLIFKVSTPTIIYPCINVYH